MRWIKRVVVLLLVALLLVAGAGYYATRHLDLIAEWAVERAFPGVDVKVESLQAARLSELVVEELELRSKATDELLLRLEGGTVNFVFADLLGWKLEAVRLKNPGLRVSPGLGKALGVGSGEENSGGKKKTFAFAIGRVVIENGSLTVASFWDRTPTVTMRVSADWTNFGIGGNVGDVPHEVVISEVGVRKGDADPFLFLDEATVKFTTAGLFVGKRVESVKLGTGDLRVPGAWNEMLPDAREEGEIARAGEGEKGPTWSVGKLDLGALSVAVGPAKFVVTASMRELAVDNATDVQHVELRKVRVAGADGEPMVVANRAVAEFTVAGLLKKEVRMVRIGYPRLWLRPQLTAGETGELAKGEGGGAERAKWRIGRVVSDYGEIRLSEMGGKIPEISAKMAFDLKDLGTVDDLVAKFHELVVWDVRARAGSAEESDPFLVLDLAKVRFSLAGLLDEKVVEAVGVDGGQLTIGEQLKGLLDAREEVPAENAPGDEVADKEKPWTIGDLSVNGVRTKLEDVRVDVSDVDFTINSTFKNVAIGVARDGLAEEVQTVEFSNLVIRSPVDPEAKIVTLRSVFVRFTLSGLANERIREIVILRPTIFLSQDLFVYMAAATSAEEGVGEEALSGRGAEGEPAVAPGWAVGKLDVKFGSLVIGSGGRTDVGLPLEFETLAEDVEFDNLAALKLRAALRIPQQSYAFESYQLELREVEGDLQFSYPPELGVNNVVQKLDIAGIRWRQYEAGESWVAVTFDEQGINGEFGGNAYDGYVNGGFSFFFQTDSPWIGWITGTAVNVETLTGIASPENFSLSGPADFEVQVDAFAKNIDRVRGKFSLTKAGKLRIGKIDDLIEKISPEWGTLKQDITRIGLETIRDFDYEDAKGDFWFVQSQGILNLDLKGPNGSRDFEVALHRGADGGGRWQEGTMKGGEE